MKRSRFLIIATLLVAAAAAVAIVSCKKDTPSAMLDNKAGSQAFNPGHIDDMNGYLKDFKQRLQSRSEEALTMEEARWHLCALANYDFAHANVEYDDVSFDTLYYHVEINEGNIQMRDLAVAYEAISSGIDGFYHNLAFDNKHFRFIGAEISEQGAVTISIITTFSNAERWHYFSDTPTFCDKYFSDSEIYYADDNAVTELERIFNLILGKDTIPNPDGRVYYVPSVTTRFYYADWHEVPAAYCPNPYHSRLYNSDGVFHYPIPKEDMCYYLDSYLGLAVENTSSRYPEVIAGDVEFYVGPVNQNAENPEEQQVGHHLLYVRYGIAMATNQNGY